MGKKFWKFGRIGYVLLLLWLLLPAGALADDSWSVYGDAYGANGAYVLTPSKSQASGLVGKNTPLDTRNGVTLSFQYYVGERVDGPREGFQVIFADHPISGKGSYHSMGYEPEYGKKFVGVEFDSKNKCISVFQSEPDGAYSSRKNRLVSVKKTISDDVWHNVKIQYQAGVVQVWQDQEQILVYNQFQMPELAYLGFSASTYLYAFGYQKHEVRGIALQSAEASHLWLNGQGGSCEADSVWALPNSGGTIPAARRKGYTFDGWAADASGTVRISGMRYPFAPIQTLYAQWKVNHYTVRMDANGGTVGKGSISVEYDAAYGTLPAPKKAGHIFSGWYTAPDGGRRVTKNTKVTEADNHTLYAHWKVRKYQVSFHPNKGSVSKKTKQVAYRKTVGTLPTPKRKGYTFLGWYTAKNGGTRVLSGRTVTKNITFYAHWVSNASKVRIKLNKNGGSCKVSSIAVKYGGKLTGLPKPTRKGYLFEGWYTEQTGGSKVSTATKTGKVLEKKTLYAHWKKKPVSSGNSGSSGSGSGGNKNAPPCQMCDGSGDCQTCSGNGYLWSHALDKERLNCYRCNTSGKCTYCHGSGKRY